MGQSILVAAEGRSDFDTLQRIIDVVAQELGVVCECKAVFPEYDATSDSSGLGGWSRLMSWLKNLNGSTQPDQALSDRDRELWQSVGMVGPARAPAASWELMLGLDDSILVLHIDGDAASVMGQHHPDGAYSQEVNIIKYCRTALYSWSGLADSRVVCAVPVQCMESWYLTLYSIGECAILCPQIVDYEVLPTEDVYNLLCSFDHDKFIDEDGNETVDKVKLPARFGDRLAGDLDKLCSDCPSARCFISDLDRLMSAKNVG